MSIKPVSPDNINKNKIIPDFVVAAANELIQKHWNGNRAQFTLEALVKLALEKKPEEDTHTKESLFGEHAFDIEPLFRSAGWRVEFDKPGYCESYDAFFFFSKGRSNG